jgi:hypothetical protein
MVFVMKHTGKKLKYGLVIQKVSENRNQEP